jgi:hypothetical protein
MHARTRIARWAHLLVVTAVAAAALSSLARAGELPPDVKAALANSTYVYIASTRKDGSLSKPAEIWFMYHNGAVYVGTPPTSWRAKRIKKGRTTAKIAVGKADGPSFTATGAIVNEPDVLSVLYETYAKKYPEGWPQFEQKFRNGFKDGSRVLIKYAPKGS